MTLHKGGPGSALAGADEERSAGGHGGGLDELPDAGSAHLNDSHRSHLLVLLSRRRQPTAAKGTKETLASGSSRTPTLFCARVRGGSSHRESRTNSSHRRRPERAVQAADAGRPRSAAARRSAPRPRRRPSARLVRLAAPPPGPIPGRPLPAPSRSSMEITICGSVQLKGTASAGAVCQLVTIGSSTVMVPTGRETGLGSSSPTPTMMLSSSLPPFPPVLFGFTPA